MPRPRIALIAGVILCLASGAQAQCRLALAMALDVSGSVDAREYRLQLDGVAGALLDPSVQAALFSVPNTTVAFHVFEWSAPQYQRSLIPWTMIDSPRTLKRIAARLQRTPRIDSPAETGLGTALIHGGNSFRTAPECDVLTLDVSGDGQNNTGPRPQDDIAQRAIAGITVNGLVVISEETGDLPKYFRAYVQHGPFAFVEQANGFDDYQTAMIRKLLREVQSMVVGMAQRP